MQVISDARLRNLRRWPVYKIIQMTIHATQSSKFTVAMIMVLLGLNSMDAKAQLHKCTNNGSVTYQNLPCQSSEPRRHPNVEQLNAERKRNAAQVSDVAASSPAAPSGFNSRLIPSSDTRTSDTNSGQYSRSTKQSAQIFSCDNRKYCSQMTSCAEATYFLNHCPGVKMDGRSKNGIPCEQQWCNR